MAHVFISYSKENRDYARKLADYLLTQGFDIWIDDRIDFGTNWEREIFKAIDGCDAFIVIMTSESYQSDWVQRERFYADKLGKQAFPLLLEGEVFPFYAIIQYYDVRGNMLPGTKFLKRLAKFVQRRGSLGHDVTAIPQLQEPPSIVLDEFSLTETDTSNGKQSGNLIAKDIEQTAYTSDDVLSVQMLIDDGDRLMSADKWDEACRSYESALQVIPYHREAEERIKRTRWIQSESKGIAERLSMLNGSLRDQMGQLDFILGKIEDCARRFLIVHVWRS